METSIHSTPTAVQNVGSMKPEQRKRPKLDEIGEWSELKLDILKKYAGAYCTILKARGLHPIYIDGFAGAGVHIRKGTKELVPGSPLNALKVEPPFEKHHWIDLDESKVAALKRQTAGLKHVHIYGGDANKILLNEVFPKIRFENFERALCILDPYGLHLNWEVIETAAKMGTVEVFLNFPVLDMNRNVLLWEPTNASADDVKRMTALWKDESWRDVAYSTSGNLFGFPEKQPNEVIAEAFRERLQKVAGFKYVPEPVPMKNSRSAILYYLFFAAQKETAENIILDILKKYRGEGVL
ncbi:MAG: three-Cys-motif partner protein TcmP [Candidatus Sulfotelmatobacter sp.]